MRKKDDRPKLYVYRPPRANEPEPELRFPSDSGAAKKRPAQPTAESEIERYYALLRVKLSPARLRVHAIINILVLVGSIWVLFVGGLLITKPTVSEFEKRDLATLPAFSLKSLFEGTLTRDLELWYADTFPMRDRFVGLGAVLDESRGVRLDDVRIIAPTGGGETQDIPPDAPSEPTHNLSAPASESSVTASDTPSAAPSESAASSDTPSKPAPLPPTPPPPSTAGLLETGEAGAISNGTFVYKGMAMSLYGGSAQSARWYADVLNTYHEELPGVQVYNMIIPTSIEFYVPDKYRELTASQKATIDVVYGRLNSDIKKVDAYSKLAAHKAEYIYFRTDHHWTGLGAYYAYTAFCEQAGLIPVSINDCETRRLDNFIGTMYSQTQDSTLLTNPDYVDYYIFPRQYEATLYKKNSPYGGVPHTLWGEYAQSPNSYSVFLHGDFPLIQIKTDNHNGRKIMIVKESFGNAFAPFLINNYEEVYIVDQRYFQLSAIEYIKQQGINELLFANNSFAVCTPYHIRSIDGLRHQYFVPPVPPAPPAPPPESSDAEDAVAADAKVASEAEQPKIALNPKQPKSTDLLETERVADED